MTKAISPIRIEIGSPPTQRSAPFRLRLILRGNGAEVAQFLDALWPISQPLADGLTQGINSMLGPRTTWEALTNQSIALSWNSASLYPLDSYAVMHTLHESKLSYSFLYASVYEEFERCKLARRSRNGASYLGAPYVESWDSLSDASRMEAIVRHCLWDDSTKAALKAVASVASGMAKTVITEYGSAQLMQDALNKQGRGEGFQGSAQSVYNAIDFIFQHDSAQASSFLEKRGQSAGEFSGIGRFHKVFKNFTQEHYAPLLADLTAICEKSDLSRCLLPVSTSNAKPSPFKV